MMFLFKFLAPKEQGKKQEDLRKKANEIIREYALNNGGCYQEAWNKVYREFNRKEHIYLKARARKEKCRPLDVVEKLGAMGVLCDIAKRVLV